MSNADSIVIACDHAGYEMKEFVKSELSALNVPFYEAGGEPKDPADDYPVTIAQAAEAVSEGKYSRGIVLCGTGIGASMTANKFKGVRAALCITPHMAELSRQHNDSNILVLGGRITSQKDVAKIMRTWLETEFEGGRHARRVGQLNDLPRQ